MPRGDRAWGGEFEGRRKEPALGVRGRIGASLACAALAIGCAHSAKDTRASPEEKKLSPCEYQAAFHLRVEENLRAIEWCYQRALSSAPDLVGVLRVRFKLGPEGEVRLATLAERSTPVEGPLVDCVLDEVRDWKFPRTPTGRPLTIVYPFLFVVEGHTRLQDAIELMVQAHRDGIQRCIDEAHRRVPDLGNSLLVRFVVGTGGGVESASAAPGSRVDDVTLVECVANELKSMRFKFTPGHRFAVDYAFALEQTADGSLR